MFFVGRMSISLVFSFIIAFVFFCLPFFFLCFAFELESVKEPEAISLDNLIYNDIINGKVRNRGQGGGIACHEIQL